MNKSDDEQHPLIMGSVWVCVRSVCVASDEYVSVIDLTNVGCRSIQLLLLLNAASKLTSSIDLSIFYSTHTHTHTDPAHQQQQQ